MAFRGLGDPGGCVLMATDFALSTLKAPLELEVLVNYDLPSTKVHPSESQGGHDWRMCAGHDVRSTPDRLRSATRQLRCRRCELDRRWLDREVSKI